ncbi:methyltransferase family protein [Stackebrandtia endophytica]|uniref:Methyltransferase family protein n=1 Tax=Stackebrandtia endophytica TaxID=1496996 RepID=A0A543AUG1_9ACTN|nr:class I SAM-dependent methyltransferase [Stackebrandtia endophytica]TQL76199.1 methyltransferase family protein [Stackebrandtia endophytica]
MTDPIFAHHRLAELYDPLDPDRSDLDVYADMVAEFGADSVLDIGCGTGTFACLLAGRDVEVTGVDPASASLDVARRKPLADRVTWIQGDATTLPPLQVDLAFMTANVAQVFLTDADWLATLAGAKAALRPGGRLVFETRDVTKRAWENWNRPPATTTIEGIDTVEVWSEVLSVDLPLVSFRWSYRFASDGEVIVSDSTLRFRERDEVGEQLVQSGFVVEEIRDAPDRPGYEFVFIARSR